MTVNITESTMGLQTAQAAGTGRIRIKIIDEGQGSSGYYPGNAIQQAVKDGLFAKGLHMYADHPGAQESYDRPERTIKDLAAVLDTDAEYVPAEKAAYAEARVFPHWREVIAKMADDIGVSIRASAEVDDSSGNRVITRLLSVESVDFVTKAGRGGKITEVLESARSAVAEATNDTRSWLHDAVAKAHQAEGKWASLVDFDESFAYFQSYDEATDRAVLMRQPYTMGDAQVQLTGGAVEVHTETRYVPVTQEAPAEEAAPKDSPPIPAGVTENRKEPTVATTTIEESALAELQAAASRATALEAENRTLRESQLQDQAKDIVAEAFGDVEAPATRRFLVESAKRKEDGSLDADALRAAAVEAAAEFRAASGEGQVSGLGDTEPSAVQEAAATVSDEDILTTLKGA